MLQSWRFRPALLIVLASTALGQTPALPQSRTRTTPRPEAVADTRLLMEGINLPNYQGLERLLGQKPTAPEAWAFARGQALLIAETSNLLMLRPPRSQGRATWMDQAAALRESATRLARGAASGDYERSRASLREVANNCNRCHQIFRVDSRFTPFKEQPNDAKPLPRRPSAPQP
jgi:hypothetical protein